MDNINTEHDTGADTEHDTGATHKLLASTRAPQPGGCVTKMVMPPHVRVRRVVPRRQSSYSLTRDAGLAFYDTCHYYIRLLS